MKLNNLEPCFLALLCPPLHKALHGLVGLHDLSLSVSSSIADVAAPRRGACVCAKLYLFVLLRVTRPHSPRTRARDVSAPPARQAGTASRGGCGRAPTKPPVFGGGGTLFDVATSNQARDESVFLCVSRAHAYMIAMTDPKTRKSDVTCCCSSFECWKEGRCITCFWGSLPLEGEHTHARRFFCPPAQLFQLLDRVCFGAPPLCTKPDP